MRISCKVEEVTLENEEGVELDGVSAECPRCGHTTESFGTAPTSIRRCLVLLREECPNRENNFYVDEDAV